MKLFLASDHAGYELKEALKPFLEERGHQLEDIGPATLDPADDYPDYILPMAMQVAEDPNSCGIAIGASGQGEAMVANRLKGVRAQVYYGPAAKKQTDASGHELGILVSPRAHENANVLSLGARFLSIDEAKEAVELWLKTPFSGEERHARRIKKIDG